MRRSRSLSGLTALGLTALGLIAATATPAAAQNHFLFELEGGVARPFGLDANVEDGESAAATFGIGGRFRGHAPAYYLVGRTGWGQLGYEGPARLGRAQVEAEQTEWAIGGRVYVPFSERLRLHVEVTAGELQTVSHVSREGHRALRVDEDRFTVFLGSGLQFRLTSHFSLGAGVNAAWMPREDDAGLAARAAGIEDPEQGFGRLRMGATATFHF